MIKSCPWPILRLRWLLNSNIISKAERLAYNCSSNSWVKRAWSLSKTDWIKTKIEKAPRRHQSRWIWSSLHDCLFRATAQQDTLIIQSQLSRPTSMKVQKCTIRHSTGTNPKNGWIFKGWATRSFIKLSNSNSRSAIQTGILQSTWKSNSRLSCIRVNFSLSRACLLSHHHRIVYCETSYPNNVIKTLLASRESSYTKTVITAVRLGLHLILSHNL